MRGAFHRTEKELCMDPNKRPDDMVRITTPELAQAFIDEQVTAIREQIGDKKVLLALPVALTALLSRRCSSRLSASNSSACM